MKLYAQTLTDYLIKNARSCLEDQAGSHELRIVTSSFPADIVEQAGKGFQEFLSDRPQKIKFIFKAGYGLLQDWQQNISPKEQDIVARLGRNEWIDEEDKLTFYRNLKLNDFPEYDFLIIILIGVDQARDKASLDDFFRVDARILWNDALRCSFVPWLQKIFAKNSPPISADEEQFEEIDTLLKLLHKNGAGDLLQMVSFLEHLDLSGAQDGKDVLLTMYENLSFWQLPKFQDLPYGNRANWPKYVQDSITFFSYQNLLKSAARNKTIKQIRNFQLKLENGEDDISFPEDIFSSVEDFLSCLKNYIARNDQDEKERLLDSNFVPIRDKILNLRNKKTRRSTPKLTKIDASPLETVLTALWYCFVDFKKICTKENLSPAASLKEIHIQGIKFRHDLDSEDEGRDLIQGCFGGLDAYITKNLPINCKIDDEQEVNIPVLSSLIPVSADDFRLERSGAGIPGFQFKIIFKTEPALQIERLFQWQTPATQPYRNLWNIVREIRRKLEPQIGSCLPVFTLSHYNELFLASDEEEANRILKLGLNRLQVVNLLKLPELKNDDPLNSSIKDLSHIFGIFLRAMEKDGFYSATEEPWRKFQQKYEKIMKEFVGKGGVGPTNQFAPLMYKAFAIVSEKDLQTPFVSYLSTAVLTGIHPSLLEMITNRDTFLVHGFQDKICRIISDTSGIKVNQQQWNDVCELATIKYPLFGLISDAGKNLNTDIKSHGLIHCFGKPPHTTAPLSAKMLLRADENEELDFTDSVLFRENRESRVIKRLLEEYVMIYPHAADGISLAILNGDNFQTIIAGINAFLKDQIGNRVEDNIPPYHFSLILLTSNSQQHEAARLLQEWKKRWESAGEIPKLSYYRQCRLSIAHRVSRNPDDYIKLVERAEFDTDIAVLIDFIAAGDVGNDVEQTEPFKVDWEHPLKFPIVETPRCSDEHPAQAYKRAKVISNRRFRLAALHSELGVYFKHPDYVLGQEYIVISEGDYGRWKKLIDILHKNSTWVVCIDPAIDEKLTGENNNSHNEGHVPREIIGFSSGVGSRGELNYTLSTERSSLAGVEKGIAKQLNLICGPWDQAKLKTTAHCLVIKSRELSGLSLVRATGPGQRNIRELIASTLVRITLPEPAGKGLILCDELISLDAFMHWFDTAGDPERPDLLRIVAYLGKNGLILIDTHLVECKLAQENSDHLNKAHVQLESGLRHLMDVFRPREADNASKFDQRYWWAQIQRLVASKSRIPTARQREVTHALEMLGEGKFTICWQAMAVAYWTDSDDQSYDRTQEWDFFFQDRQLAIDVICAGAGIILPICKGEEQIVLPCSGSTVCFPQDITGMENDKETLSEQSETKEPEFKEKDNTDATHPTETVSDDSKHEQHGIDVNKHEIKTDSNSKDSMSQGNIDKEEEAIHVADVDEDTVDVIAIPASAVPERVFLGETLGAVQREVFWEFGHSGLSNRHFLIFGQSGVGKTYAIQAILLELAKLGQHTAIIDYTSGFLKKHLEAEFKAAADPKTYYVKKTPLPINPFRQRRMLLDEDFEDIEDAYSVAGRVTSVFTSVYSSFGEQQKALLHKVIEAGIESYADGYNFERLLEDLENDASANAVTVANKLTPLGRANLFQGKKGNSWQQIYSDPESNVNILQLAGLSRDLSKMATEFILWDLYDFASNQGSKNRPLPMVLDEIQNLDHRLDSPLGKFLTEGRKFGLSAILATQTLSNLSQEAQSRLFMATHKLFFRPADPELKEYATLLANATSEKINIWKEKLVALNKGECYSLGPSLNLKTGKLEEKAFPIRISAMEKRLARRND